MCKFVAIMCTLMLASSVYAALDVPADSSLWAGKYEGNVLPTSDGWTTTGSTETFMADHSSVSGGVLNVNTIGTDGLGWYTKTGTGIDFDKGFAIEAKVSNNAFEGNGSFGIVAVATNGKYMNLDLRAIRASIVNNYWIDYVPVDESYAGYHTVRVEFEGSTVTAWVNGVLATANGGAFSYPQTMAWWGDTDPDQIYWGDMTAGADTNMDVDYIRWQTVPEPATMTLSLLGMLFLRRRKSA
jgi:hypothetical protein